MSAHSADTIRYSLQSRPPAAAPGSGDYALNPQLSHLFSALRTPAAVLILLVEREEGLTVLITKRSDSLPVHAGQCCCPGGRAEPEDRDSADTALRETEEETGISRDKVEILGILPDYVTRTGFLITPVVGVVRPPFELNPNPAEVAEVLEVPLAVFLDPVRCRMESIVVPGGAASFYSFEYEGRIIWGATAGLLVSLREALKEPAAPANALRPAL